MGHLGFVCSSAALQGTEIWASQELTPVLGPLPGLETYVCNVSPLLEALTAQ